MYVRLRQFLLRIVSSGFCHNSEHLKVNTVCKYVNTSIKDFFNAHPGSDLNRFVNCNPDMHYVHVEACECFQRKIIISSPSLNYPSLSFFLYFSLSLSLALSLALSSSLSLSLALSLYLSLSLSLSPSLALSLVLPSLSL